MQVNKVIFCFFILYSFIYSYLSGFTISESGQYVFGDNLIGPGGDVLVIDADNVIIDLNQHIVGGGTRGIVIANGHSNIRIKNGAIAVAAIGLSIQDNCSSIGIENVGLSLCAARAIEMVGTSTGGVSDIILNGVAVRRCSSGPAADAVIHIENGDNVTINRGSITNCGTILRDIALLRIQDSVECNCISLIMLNNEVRSLIGIDVVNSNNCKFQRCNISTSNVVGSPGNFTGIRLTGTQQVSNLFSKCSILDNTCDNEFIGFDIQNNSKGTIIGKSGVTENRAQTLAIAYRVSGTGSPSSTMGTIFSEDNAVRNSASDINALVAGFQIQRADEGTIRKCISSYNEAEQGEAHGILFESGFGGNEWTLLENEIIGNVGNSAANSFGINVATGSDNLFVKNVAFDNGAISANQMAGIAAGSIQQLNPSNLNSATSPWSNIVVTT